LSLTLSWAQDPQITDTMTQMTVIVSVTFVPVPHDRHK